MRSVKRHSGTLIKIILAAYLLTSNFPSIADPLKKNAAAENSTTINDIIKSENDDRTYRYLTLANHMQVLLISDPKTEKSAAALDVNIGSGEDPDARPGLAHFLEHMLFLGTKKYPKPGEYQEYISAHSGGHNAYTSLEHTNFHFDIDPQYLDPALDRFAQFFIAPLLDGNYVAHERNAVHSEYSAKIKDESRRSWDVLGELTNPANKSARFSVGTLDTLADHDKKKTRDELLKFYQANYSANLMALVVLGKETPDQLEQMVRSRFNEVTNKNIQLSHQELPLFTEGYLPKKVYIRPLQDQRILSLIFPMPVFEQWYREKPVDYIAYMLGHEGSGGLYQTLREKGWVESLAAGPDTSNRQSASFSISIALTQEGYLHQDEIVDFVYQAIDRLKTSGVEKWRYNEQSVINDTLFRYQEKSDALDYVSTLANNLHYYPPRNVISAMLTMENYDETLIHRYLDYLKPENALLMLNAKDVPVTETSRYYQTQYSVADVKADDLKHWSKIVATDSIQLPNPNEFVAKKFRVKKGGDSKSVEQASANPTLLRRNPNLRLWFKRDDHFNVPRGGIYVYARNARSANDAQGAALTKLLVGMVNNNLNSYTYAAKLAGLELNLSQRSRGIGIEITGYSDKQGLLLTRVLDALVSPTFRQEDFDSVKEELLRELMNFDKQAPYKQIGNELPALLSRTDYENAAMSQAIKTLQLKDVQEFALKWLGAINADVLIHGNYTESDALKLAAIIENKLQLHGPLHPDPQGLYVNLPSSEKGFLYPMPVDHPDTAMMQYFQGADTSAREQATFQLLAQLMSSEFFHKLRTEQQLGYVVYAGYHPLAFVPGLAFVVQSPTHSAEEIDTSINNFFADFAKTLSAMPSRDFEQQRQALINNLAEKPKNLAEEGAEFWSQITYRYLSFDQREQLIKEVKSIDSKTLAAYYWKMFLSPKVQRIVVVTTPKNQALNETLSKKYRVINNSGVLKTNAEYFILK